MSQSGLSLIRLRNRYVDAVIRGEESQAGLIVDEGLQQAYSVSEIYLGVLAPAQVHVGEGWHDGNLNVAQEHLATQITLAQMNRLRAHFVPTAKLGYRAVVTTVEGDPHLLGARMVADFFIADGWDVDFLGPETPGPDLVELVEQRGADLVVISVTLDECLPRLDRTAKSLANLTRPPKVLVGGNAVANRPEPALGLGAHAVARSISDAVPEGRRLLGLTTRPHSLEDCLEFLGRRVQELRRERGWNQQRLAGLADLDRTYISAVEHGKQNLTLGAVLRLATALGVDLGELLIDGGGRNTGPESQRNQRTNG